jgi:hypothetical protein
MGGKIIIFFTFNPFRIGASNHTHFSIHIQSFQDLQAKQFVVIPILKSFNPLILIQKIGDVACYVSTFHYVNVSSSSLSTFNYPLSTVFVSLFADICFAGFGCHKWYLLAKGFVIVSGGDCAVRFRFQASTAQMVGYAVVWLPCAAISIPPPAYARPREIAVIFHRLE